MSTDKTRLAETAKAAMADESDMLATSREAERRGAEMAAAAAKRQAATSQPNAVYGRTWGDERDEHDPTALDIGRRVLALRQPWRDELLGTLAAYEVRR